MNIIYQSTGVRYNEVHLCGLLYKWDSNQKVPRKRFVNIASKEEKGEYKKIRGK
jgi:hypothetical protein